MSRLRTKAATTLLVIAYRKMTNAVISDVIRRHQSEATFLSIKLSIILRWSTSTSCTGTSFFSAKKK